MANWFIQEIDKSDENRKMPYVKILPQMLSWEESSHQENPSGHPSKSSIGTPSGGYNPQYFHYCTALYRWKHIDPSKLADELGKGPTYIHSTKRFGDMGGYYISNSQGFRDLGFVDRPNSVFSRYRFKIEDCVPYAQYGARGASGGNRTAPFSPNARTGVTAGWIPNSPRDNSWRPSGADIDSMVAGIEQDCSNKGCTLQALKDNTDQKWNAAIVVWFWAGYQREKKDKDTGATITPYKGARNRSVDACDAYFFGYLY